MAKFIEKETDVPVDIVTIRRFRGHPDVAIVTYPDGTSYGLLAERIYETFDIVTPQEISIGGDMRIDYERCD